MWYTKHVISRVHNDRMLEAGKANQSKHKNDDDMMLWVIAANTLPPPMQVHGCSQRKACDCFGGMPTYHLSDTTIRIFGRVWWYARESIRAIVVHNVVHKARHQHSHNDRMLEAGKAKQSKQVMTTRCFGLLQQTHCRHQCKYADARNAKLAIASEGCARTDCPIPSSVFEYVFVCEREHPSNRSS